MLSLVAALLCLCPADSSQDSLREVVAKLGGTVKKRDWPEEGQPRMFDNIEDAMERGCIVKVHDGDERATLARKGPKNYYSALFVEITRTDLRDINTQLFTKEAMADFMGSLTEKGVLCFHVSHRYYDMVPPLADAAKALGLAWKMCQDKGAEREARAPGSVDELHFSSQWVMVARKAAYLEHLKDTKTMTWTVPASTWKYVWRDGEKIDLEPLKRKDKVGGGGG